MYNILDLPAELLVFIISFLSSRNVVTLRYVSRRLRAFAEVPSLWRKFVWTYYRSCEKASVIEILKVCGNHIRQLSFTNDRYLPSSDCDLMLSNCAIIAHLTLLMQKPYAMYELSKILQNLKLVKKLEILWSEVFYPASLLKNSNLTEVTLYVTSYKSFSSSSFRYEACVQDYILAGCKPQYLNIVPDTKNGISVFRSLLQWWAYHSTRDQYRPPDGYTAHLKIYGHYKVPFNLFPSLPQFHIQFSLTPTVTVFRCDQYTVLNQKYYSLKLHHCSCSNRNCNCLVLSASVNENIISYHDAAPRDRFDKHMSDYTIQWSVNDMKSLLNKNLEQLSFLIPNLQRLDLSHYNVSKHNMRGLRAVANNCRNLKGLKLKNTHAMNPSLNPKELWEILSGMKLTHLSIEHCLTTSAAVDNQQEMFNFNLCSTLQAIEIGLVSICEVCKTSSSKDFLCLSQFSSLEYCRVSHTPLLPFQCCPGYCYQL